MRLIKRLLLILACLGIFLYVIFYIEPPKTWASASYFQILVFFIPILLFFTFLVDILIDYLPKSLLIGLLIMSFGVFYCSGILNVFSGGILFILIIAAIKYFPDKGLPLFSRGLPRLNRSLTRLSKIPKISRFRRIKK